MDYESCRNIVRPFGFQQLITLIVLHRARSNRPNEDPFILALEHELNDKITEQEKEL